MGIDSVYDIILAIWNIIVFFIYGTDKLLAKMQKRRISERLLITTSIFMGAVGAIFAMVVFNHKTKKMKFRICIPLAVLLNAIILWWFKGR